MVAMFLRKAKTGKREPTITRHGTIRYDNLVLAEDSPEYIALKQRQKLKRDEDRAKEKSETE